MTNQIPAALARIALKRIAELKLSPTPENFSRFYFEASGLLSSSPSAAPPVPRPLDDSTLEQFDLLVAKAVSTTTSLATGLGRHDADLNASLEAAANQSASQTALDLLHVLLNISQEMHATVKASRDELIETRRSMDDIKAQLKESQELLVQDALTGTGNRRAMNSILDAALVHLTNLACSMLRGNDAFIRYGGEEFLLVLPETALQGGVATGQRLQNLLKRQALFHDGRPIPMAFSGGACELRPDDNEATLLRRADEALYEAKGAGRNLILAGRP